MADVRFFLKAVKSDSQRELSGVVPVGRGILNGIALTVEGASRKHALLSVVDGEAYVEDTHSTNGTFVNDVQISSKCRLSPGDRIRFHTQEFELLRIESAKDTVVVAHNSEAPKNKDVGWIIGVKFDDRDHTQQCSPEQYADLEKQSAQRRLANLAAPPVKESCLIFLRDNEPNVTVPLVVDKSLEQQWIVGRRPECDIHIDAKGVSGVHAKILRHGNQWYAIDALSANGMFVNNFQAGKQYLSAGDSIRFGNVECIFRLPGRVRAARRPIPQSLIYFGAAVGTCLVLLAIWWALKMYWPQAFGGG
jgi:pSer/pThr/pTyr-binding forkhead associated (FHA) protein